MSAISKVERSAEPSSDILDWSRGWGHSLLLHPPAQAHVVSVGSGEGLQRERVDPLAHACAAEDGPGLGRRATASATSVTGSTLDDALEGLLGRIGTGSCWVRRLDSGTADGLFSLSVFALRLEVTVFGFPSRLVRA